MAKYGHFLGFSQDFLDPGHSTNIPSHDPMLRIWFWVALISFFICFLSKSVYRIWGPLNGQIWPFLGFQPRFFGPRALNQHPLPWFYAQDMVLGSADIIFHLSSVKVKKKLFSGALGVPQGLFWKKIYWNILFVSWHILLYSFFWKKKYFSDFLHTPRFMEVICRPNWLKFPLWCIMNCSESI